MGKKLNIQLLVIDPQNDFCQPNGALYVNGADQDMIRLSKMINRLSDKIDDIHVTMDSHHLLDIAHPLFWASSNGKHPNPFTIISKEDVQNKIWRSSIPYFQKHTEYYVEQLEKNNRYALCIWPPHCLIGSSGYGIYPELLKELNTWEENHYGMVNYVTKGSNYKTEHYSAVQADVPDSEDLGTLMNDSLITLLEEADILLIAGEARSHCLKFTAEDIADKFGDQNIQKMHLLVDCCSDVTGFEQNGEDFVRNMVKRGMKTIKSTEFLV